MGRVIVLGSSNTDLVLRTDRLPSAGQTVLGSEFFQAPGGKGANQAVAAARAGAEVTFLAAIGDDALGQTALATLARENLDLRYVRIVHGVSSGVALVLVDADGQNQIGVGMGANAHLSESDVAQLPDEVFEAPAVFVTQLETPEKTALAGLQRARQAGILTLFNPAPPTTNAGQSDWLSQVDVLVVNEHEAQVLTKTTQPLADRQVIANVLSHLLDLGCQYVVITLGDCGFAYADRQTVTFVPAISVHPIDTVAAGDAFVGAMACVLSQGRSVLEAATWANAAAAISVTRSGAQPSLAYRSEIDQMANRSTV